MVRGVQAPGVMSVCGDPVSNTRRTPDARRHDMLLLTC